MKEHCTQSALLTSVHLTTRIKEEQIERDYYQVYRVRLHSTLTEMRFAVAQSARQLLGKPGVVSVVSTEREEWSLKTKASWRFA